MASVMLFGVYFLNPTITQAAPCAPRATKECISNIVYWYDSCGAVNSIYQNCNTTGQICRNATCVNQSADTPPTPVPTTPIGQEYNPGAGENTSQNQPTYQAPAAQVQDKTLAAVLFAKKTDGSGQWGKYIDTANSHTIDLFIVVKNISNAPLDNVTVLVNLGNAATFAGNLAVDSLAAVGNVANGINLGTLQAGSSKSISFSAQTQAQAAGQITAAVSIGQDIIDSDAITIASTPQGTIIGATNNIATGTTTGSSTFFNFVKKWYIWGIVIIILIVLFSIIYRRLASSV